MINKIYYYLIFWLTGLIIFLPYVKEFLLSSFLIHYLSSEKNIIFNFFDIYYDSDASMVICI